MIVLIPFSVRNGWSVHLIDRKVLFESKLNGSDVLYEEVSLHFFPSRNLSYACSFSLQV